MPPGHPSERDLTSFLKSNQTHIRRKLTEEVLDLRPLKLQLAVEVGLRKDASNGAEVLMGPVFGTKQIVLLPEHENPPALHGAFPGLLRRLKNFTNEGSGLVANRVTKLWLYVAHYQPLRGGTYLPFPQRSGTRRQSSREKQ